MKMVITAIGDIENLSYLWFHAAGGFYRIGCGSWTEQLFIRDENKYVCEWRDCYILSDNKTIDLTPDFFDLEESNGFSLFYAETNHDKAVDVISVNIDGEDIPVSQKKYTVISEWEIDGERCTIRPFKRQDMEVDGYSDSGRISAFEVDCYSDLELAIKSSCFRPNVINFSGLSPEEEKEKEKIITKLCNDKEYMKLWA